MRKAISTALIISVCTLQQLEAAPHAMDHAQTTTPDTSAQLLATRFYNAVGQVTDEGDSDVTNPQGNHFTQYIYTTQDQLHSRMDRDGHVVTQTYNDHGLVTSQVAQGNNGTVTLTANYDEKDDQVINNGIQSTENPHSRTTAFNYDLAGQVTSKTYSPEQKTQSFTYDRQGNIHTFTNIAGQIATYQYTAMQQLQSVALSLPNKVETTTYQYNPFGQVTNTHLPNDIQTTWSYDDYDGIREIKSINGNTTLQDITYTYAINGDTQTKKFKDGTTYQYAYNPLNELSQFQCQGTSCPQDKQGQPVTTRRYAYTLNRDIQSMTTNSASKVTYHYDTPNYPDRLISTTASNGTYHYDANGNMTMNAKGETFTYNALNQMIAFTPAASNDTSSPETFAYNTDGKLIQEGDKANPVTLYYSTGQQPTVTAKTQGSATDTYALGLNRIAQYYTSSAAQTATPTTQYYLSDQHGDITHVINGTDNAAYLYTPFGYLSHLGPSNKEAGPVTLNNNTFGYIGQSLSANTGLMMMGGYRAYNPNLGVFVKQDSYSPFQSARTLNGFDYAAGNPIVYTDPSGHDPVTLAAEIVALVTETVATEGADIPALAPQIAAIIAQQGTEDATIAAAAGAATEGAAAVGAATEGTAAVGTATEGTATASSTEETAAASAATEGAPGADAAGEGAAAATSSDAATQTDDDALVQEIRNLKEEVRGVRNEVNEIRQTTNETRTSVEQIRNPPRPTWGQWFKKRVLAFTVFVVSSGVLIGTPYLISQVSN